MSHSAHELESAIGAIKAQAAQITAEEGDAYKEKFGPYHDKKTVAGRKIHVPRGTLIDVDHDRAFVITSISRKKLIMEGPKRPLAIGQKLQIFEGLFIVSSHRERKGGTGKTIQVHDLTPCKGTKINPHPLRR